MYLSKSATLKVLSVALLVTLCSVGLQAEHHKSHVSSGCGCQAPPVAQAPSCPAPSGCAPVQLEKPAPTGCPQACEGSTVSIAGPYSCCPVDPKEVAKAKKEADHAAHEAAEACHRQQREAA